MLSEFLPAQVFGFLLVFARIGAAVMLLPGIGENYVSSRVRLAFALGLTLVIYPLVAAGLPASPTQPLMLFTLISAEVLHGLFIGGAARLMISALHVAGVVIAFQSSLAYAQTVDPNQGSQGALVSSFLTMAGVLLIFVTGLHTVLIAGIHDSYVLFPVGQAPPAGDFAALVVKLVSGAFAIGIKMAVPFVIYGILFYMGLGLLQRLMPQIQLFFIAMPVQMMLAFFVLALVFSASLLLFLNHFEENAAAFLAPK